MARTISMVRLAGGLRLPCAIQGAGGIPLLLLHGYTDSWRSFAPLLDHLPGHLRAIAPTQRGHGEADRPAHGYRPEDFAGDVRHLLDALAIDRAVIAGHSMGSNVALRFAIDHPDRTAGLALLGAYTTLRGNPVIEELWAADVEPLRDPVDPAFARAFQESTLAQPVPAAFLDTVVAESLKVPARVWRDTLAACRDCDFTAEIATVRAPTLILWGARDAIMPEAQQRTLARLIPDARLLIYPDAGHGLHWEEPERAARDLACFVAAPGAMPCAG
ncbi:MAG: alpha/beta hydrolase [Alphaproteobacteria bacterium]|nr:alpha/beta hydrolase [Alphaproteobacteria bacterium]